MQRRLSGEPTRLIAATIAVGSLLSPVSVVVVEAHGLYVKSSPVDGVPITVSPADTYGRGNGTTSFARSYATGTDVKLTAPTTHNNSLFSHWVVDEESPMYAHQIHVTMDSTHTATACYDAAPGGTVYGLLIQDVYTTPGSPLEQEQEATVKARVENIWGRSPPSTVVFTLTGEITDPDGDVHSLDTITTKFSTLGPDQTILLSIDDYRFDKAGLYLVQVTLSAGTQSVDGSCLVQVNPAPSYLYVTVNNNDDDPLDVQYALDQGQYNRSIRVEPSSTATGPDIKVEPGTHAVRIRWLDPDVGAYLTLDESSGVSAGQRKRYSFDIPLNLAVNISKVEAHETPPASGAVIVTYDLALVGQPSASVSLQISADGGTTWAVPVKSVSGDIGAGVTAGTSKQITWNAHADIPSQYGDNYKARVCAEGSCAESGVFSLDKPPGSSTFAGLVVAEDAQGRPRGPLAGATVSVAGEGVTTTDAQGWFHFTGLQEGKLTVTVTKTGYHWLTEDYTLRANQTSNVVLYLRSLTGAELPTAFNFFSPGGKHLIEGIPGSLSFAATLAWYGTAGTASFVVAGTRYPAVVTDLGGGLARANLTIPAPQSVETCGEVTVDLTNGEGRTSSVKTGVYVYPTPEIIPSWYGTGIDWAVSGPKLSFSQEFSTEIWALEILSGLYSSSASIGMLRELAFDLQAGTFEGSLGGFGTFEQNLSFPDVELLGEGQLTMIGKLVVPLAGCGQPMKMTPQWELSATGKAGIGAPVILVVDIIFPPVAPIIHGVLEVPIVKDVVGALKVRLYLIGGLSVAGEYADGTMGNCYLGTTSLTVSGTLGVEGELLVELFGAEAGIYAGLTGTPELQVCPYWQFQGITFRGYIGAFASVLGFEYRAEAGAEIKWYPGGEGRLTGLVPLDGASTTGTWKPIGVSLLRWGDANRPVNAGVANVRRHLSLDASSGSEEETLVENVTQLGCPSLTAEPSETIILYSRHDPSKPPLAATDIGWLRRADDGAWSPDVITDDDVAEFSPRITPVSASTFLGAWERVSGDVSGATGPMDVAPRLEIVVSQYDRGTATWSAPIQLTANDVVDRSPLPVVIGASQGVVWIQNESTASPGDATHGDRLVFAQFSETGWAQPQTLWSGQKGILGHAFVTDSTGEGHVVFAVDEDGDSETRTDRELYRISTTGGVWQSATRLTNDNVEDALPVLVAPGGVPMCVWSTGGTVSYTRLDHWSPKTIFAEYTMANQAPSLDGVTVPGGAAVAYTVQGPSGVDIVASFYDANLDIWSLPRQLTHDEHVETALSVAYDGEKLVLAYLKTQTERLAMDIDINGEVHHVENVPQPGRTDLCILHHALGNDLAIAPESVNVNPPNPAPGAGVTLSATIENRGDLPVADAEVTFYDGDPNSGGIRIGDAQISSILIAGGSSRVSMPWTVPLDAKTHEVFVVADPSFKVVDRDRANNSAAVTCVLPDLVIETARYDAVSTRTVALTAKVVNSGTIPSGPFALSWRLENPEGAQLASVDSQSIEPGGENEIMYLWDKGNRPPGSAIQVVAIADGEGTVHEADETNNTRVLVVVLPAAIPGDFDGDGDIDRNDLHQFIVCVTGPSIAGSPAPGCTVDQSNAADFDHDSDVDQSDFGIFQGCYSGPDVIPDPQCADNPLPTPLQASATADRTTIEQGECATLRASVTGGTPPYVYEWSAPGGWASNDAAPLVCPEQSMVYSLTVRDADKPPQVATTTVSVTVVPAARGWARLTPPNSPLARDAHGMAYDAGRHVAVTFGGRTANDLLADTWVWDGYSWSDATPAAPNQSPAARAHHSMVYDTTHGVVVLYGGFSYFTEPLNDIWTWDGSMWAKSTPSTPIPSPRFGHGMAYDEARGVSVLFGGYDNTKALRDTWLWNGLTWVDVTPAAPAGPAARLYHRMVYDGARGAVILVAGEDEAGTVYEDTWAFDGSSWQLVSNTGPGKRYCQGLAHDSVRRRTVLFGGYGPSLGGYLNDTLTWDGSQWTSTTPSASDPSPRYCHTMAFDSGRGVTVLFGGAIGSTRLNDTWKFRP